MLTKDAIRLQKREKRRTLSADFIECASAEINKKLWNKVKDLKTVMVYMSSFKEPDTKPLIDLLFKHNINVVVPISNTDSHTITPSLISSFDMLSCGAYGISEPSQINAIGINQIDCCIIPGIAFSKCGERLGFGMGYYDKFLSEFDGLKIGVCYDFQVEDELPTLAHDIRMDIIVTEKRIYNDF